METLSARIFWVTEELRAVQQQLQRVSSQADADQQERVLDELLKAGFVDDLKTAVDHMRQFLWRCLEAAADRSHPVDYALQSRRLQQITAMLRILQSCSGPSRIPLGFVEHITLWVDRHAGMEPARREPGT